MADDAEQNLEILNELGAKVLELEDQAADIRQEIEELVEEGKLRARLVEMTRSDLQPRVHKRFREDDSAELHRLPGVLETHKPSERNDHNSRRPQKGDLPRTKAGRVPHEVMVDWCKTILRNEGREMKTREIHQRLEENPKWRVPGAGTVSNVSAHLGQSKAFKKGKQPGTWCLAEDF